MKTFLVIFLASLRLATAGAITNTLTVAWDKAVSHTNVIFELAVTSPTNVVYLLTTNTTLVVSNFQDTFYRFTVCARNTNNNLLSDPSNEITYDWTRPVTVKSNRFVGLGVWLQKGLYPEGPFTPITFLGWTPADGSSNQAFFRSLLVIQR